MRDSRLLPIALLVVLLSCQGAFGAPHRDSPALVAEHPSLTGHAAVPEQHPENDPGNPDCVAVLAVDASVLAAALAQLLGDARAWHKTCAPRPAAWDFPNVVETLFPTRGALLSLLQVFRL